MLSEKHMRLLTAFVDDELSPRQRRTAIRLLKKSSTARKMLRQLQGDSRRLRALPRTQLPADFSTQVLREIVKVGQPVAAPPAAAVAASGIPVSSWVSLAMAASLFGAAVVGSYLIFSNKNSPDEGPSHVAEKTVKENKTEIKPSRKETRPEPKKVVDPGPLPLLLLTATKLRDDAARKQLAQVFGQPEKAFEVNVTSRDNARTVAQLTRYFKEADIRLVVEPAAQKSLKEKKKGARFLLYAENVSPYDLQTILQKLSKERNTSLQTVALHRLTNDQRGKVSGFLGVKPDALRLPPSDHRLPPAPFEAIVPAPKIGPQPKAQPGQPSPDTQLALVLALDRGSGIAPSHEVQNFLKTRRPVRPGSLQIVMVLVEVTT
jgi:hypothetical protein